MVCNQLILSQTLLKKEAIILYIYFITKLIAPLQQIELKGLYQKLIEWILE
jgi:hypothetical protein